jgi:hypothetical protein
MPWCGYWATGGFALWWLLPLIGIALMGVMFFVCSRRFACMGGRRRICGGVARWERDVEGSKQDAREPSGNPS